MSCMFLVSGVSSASDPGIGLHRSPGVQKELAMYIGVGAILLVLLIVVLFGTMRRRA
jgi:hypothetical protein